MSSPKHTPIRAPRSRRRRAARWLVVTLLGAFLTLAIWNVVRREWVRTEGNRELAGAVAVADRDDPAWRWEDLNAARLKPPDDKNGAALTPRIKQLSHAEWGKELAKDEWKPLLDVPPNVRYLPRVIAEARRELAESAEAVALARTLKDRSWGHRELVLKPNVLDTLLEDTQNTRHTADLLRWDVVLAGEEGDVRRAADDLFALLNASRSIGDEPFMISQLVRIATRAIAVRSAERVLAQFADASSLAELQAAFAADAEEPLLLYGLRGDRAAFDKLFENLDNGTANPAKSLDWTMDNPWERFSWWHYRGYLPADRAAYLAWMTRCVEHARLPIHEQPGFFGAIPIPPKDPRRVLSTLLLPAADRVAHAHWRGTSEARCAVVGIACERFRLRNARWPESLAELVPAFLPSVPLDPFDGEPLRYVKSETGVVVHSVGRRLPQQANLAVPAPNLAGFPDDVEFGFRLWNPEHRRQPPLPEPPAPEQDP